MRKRTQEVDKEKLVEDVKVLVSDAEAMLKATAGDVSQKAAEARSRLSDALLRAKETCIGVEEDAIERARAAAVRADQVVRSRPYESIGVACLVGLFAGLLLTRR